MVMTLQKLVHLHAAQDSDSESDDGSVRGPMKKRGSFSKAIHKLFSSHKAKEKYDEKKSNIVGDVQDPTNGYVTGHTDGVTNAPRQKLRTLQRYNFGGNQERIAYMEKHSPLTRKGLAVSAEQVSIFLTTGMLHCHTNWDIRYVSRIVQPSTANLNSEKSPTDTKFPIAPSESEIVLDHSRRISRVSGSVCFESLKRKEPLLSYVPIYLAPRSWL